MDFYSIFDALIVPAASGLGILAGWWFRKRTEADIAAQADRREHSQEAENIAISILREMIHERSKEVDDFREQLWRNNEEIKRLRESVRFLAGEIGKKDN